MVPVLSGARMDTKSATAIKATVDHLIHVASCFVLAASMISRTSRYSLFRICHPPNRRQAIQPIAAAKGSVVSHANRICPITFR